MTIEAKTSGLIRFKTTVDFFIEVEDLPTDLLDQTKIAEHWIEIIKRKIATNDVRCRQWEYLEDAFERKVKLKLMVFNEVKKAGGSQR